MIVNYQSNATAVILKKESRLRNKLLVKTITIKMQPHALNQYYRLSKKKAFNKKEKIY